MKRPGLGDTGGLAPDGEPEYVFARAGDARVLGLWKWPQPGYPELCVQAEAEGHTFLRRLTAEWEAGLEAYVGLWGAYRGEELVGIGGLTSCPFSRSGTGRVRRLYVAPAARCGGVGRALVDVIKGAAVPRFHSLTLRTPHPEVGRWYETQGFKPTSIPEGVTHLWRVPRG